MRLVTPSIDCPKCGQERAFNVRYEVNRSPRYHRESVLDSPYTREWLGWLCLRCGYEHETPTVDAAEASHG